MFDAGLMLNRLIQGLALLRATPMAELLPHYRSGGWLFVHGLAFLISGPILLVLTLASQTLVIAWRLGPDIAMPPDASTAKHRVFSSVRFRSPGVPAMPKALKTLLSTLAVLLLLWIFSPFAIVPAGNRGVVTTFGKVSSEVLDEGLHFRIPIAQTVHLMDVRIQKGEGSGDAASRDLQQVHTTVALNYHIDPKSAAEVFRELGQSIGDRIIVPAVQEAVKAATAQYTAEELIAKRPEVRDRIRNLLTERLIRHGVVVDEFSIVNFTFSKSFNEAIEAKTTAEQLKLKAERDLQRIRVEAEQKVTQAKAEAEALALQKQQVTAELIRLREIENQRKAIEKWDGKLPQVSGAATPFINVGPVR